VQVALILGAVLVAPLFEEFCFRGHLQTLLRRVFAEKKTGAGSVLPAAPFPQADNAEAPLNEPPPVRRRVRGTWLAIILTSLMFAAVHPVWSWPPIFVLSLCLGYAYERTGNLWTSITIHALFNSISTAVFLSGLLGPH